MFSPDDFHSLFLHAAGTSEVPKCFFEWASFSLLAACLNDRVYYCKHPGDKLYPNLYITLVGPSGSGKDFAAKFASKFVRDNPNVFRYYGKISGAGLADVLAFPDATTASIDGRPTVWMVFPELANSIGKKDLADDFVKRLTALSAGEDDVYRESTRSLISEGREITYAVPLLNCLFGSTQRWLIECVTKEAVESGFFARMLTVDGAYDPAIRIPRPILPADHAEAIDELRRRIAKVCKLKGEFTLTDRARAIHDRWYMDRPYPDDERMRPLWKRMDDNVLKLGMVFSKAVQRSHEKHPLVITSLAMQHAQQYAHYAYSALAPLLRWANRSGGQMNNLEVVADLVRAAGRIQHSPLLKKVTHRGMHGKEMAEHLKVLTERKSIKVERLASGGRAYVWNGS